MAPVVDDSKIKGGPKIYQTIFFARRKGRIFFCNAEKDVPKENKTFLEKTKKAAFQRKKSYLREQVY